MKKILKTIGIVFSIFLIYSCEKDNIPYYKDMYNAVRFPKEATEGFDIESSYYYSAFTFIEHPFDEYAICTLPIHLIGNLSTIDRKVNYKVDNEKSNAPEGSYEILDATIPAKSASGTINIKVYNTTELTEDEKTYELYLTLENSEDLAAGPGDYIRASLSWNNMIPAPLTNNHVRVYNMLIKSSLAFTSTSRNNYSPIALKTIVTALNWNNWDDKEAHSEYPYPSSYFTYKYLPDYRLVYTDGTYKAYAARLDEYIKKYNKEHPNSPLLHDAGALKDQPIEARSY